MSQDLLRDPTNRRRAIRSWWPAALSVFGLVGIAFLGGAAVQYFKVFPQRFLSAGFTASRAFVERYVAPPSRYEISLWTKARYHQKGVTTHDPDKAMPGYTLYTSGHAQAAFLIDMAGNEVHRWSRSFREIWPEGGAVGTPIESGQIYYRRAKVFPNGDLLALLIGEGDTPWGYGLVKLDRDSNVIWRFADRVHHDFDTAGDGTIYVLSHTFRRGRFAATPKLPRTFLDDEIVQLSPGGVETGRTSIFDALVNSPYVGDLRDLNYWDPLHSNTVELVDPDLASAFPGLTAGEVVVSLRNMDFLIAVDLARKTVTAALTGGWRRQHDPDLLQSGEILLFDNLGNLGPEGRSRVIQIDPSDGRITWSYTGTVERPLYSLWRSTQQRLANGNTLITESGGGRLLEVTAAGDIVWEFINPVRGGAAGDLIPIVSGGTRLSPDEVPFLRD